MSDFSVNRTNSGSYYGITKLDKTPNVSKQPEDSIALGSFDTVDVKKPELILSKTSGDLFHDALGSGYIKGEQTLDELKSEFKNEFDMYLNMNIDQCRISLNNKEDIKAILDSVFKNDYFNVINSTLHASGEKGQEFGEGVYYSADYYYIAEDMTNALKDAYKEVCAEYGIEDTQLPDVPYKTYNDLWGQMASGKILFDFDNAGPPPKGFEMFYKNDSNKQKNIDPLSFDEYSVIRQDGNSPVTESMTLKIPKGTDIKQTIMKYQLQNFFSYDGQFIRPTSKGWELLHKLNHEKNIKKDDLPLNAAGKTLGDDAVQFLKDSVSNVETGHVTVRCGDWSTEETIPFNYLTKNYFSNGSNLTKSWDSDQAVKDYLSNFTFRSNTSSNAYLYDGVTPRINQII